MSIVTLEEFLRMRIDRLGILIKEAENKGSSGRCPDCRAFTARGVLR